MLTHDAVMWEYVSCLINGRCMPATFLHAMPLYHCAQLDVFLGPSIYVGCTNVITAQARARKPAPLIERVRITSFFAPPTVWIALLRSPLFDRTDLSRLRKGYYGASIMPVEVLRELQSGCRTSALESLRTDRDRAARDHARARRAVPQPGSCGRAVAQC